MEIKIQAVFDDDSKRFHRFLIESNQWGVMGSIYVPKAKEVPSGINIRLLTKAEKEDGNK